MGIVNVTPDSFSDGGLHLEASRAIAHGMRLRDEGADIIDVGGESTRPGAHGVSPQDELARVIPVVAGLAREGIAVSVDTMKPEVMRAALDAGACLVNDVNAFRAPGAREALVASGASACVMHMRGTPLTMQSAPQYDDVVAEVSSFLAARAAALEAAGVARARIAIDPGFGFGKTLEQNLALLRALGRIAALGYPVLAGLSRKRMIGDITGRDVAHRLGGSVAAALLAVQNGASLVRVHDVKETVDAIRFWLAAST